MPLSESLEWWVCIAELEYRLDADAKAYHSDKLPRCVSQVFELPQGVRIDRRIVPISPTVDVPCRR
jgi:hypothetical protein